MITPHGVNGYSLANDSGRILATLDAGEFSRIIKENLQRQGARNPGAKVVSVDLAELQEAVEAQIRRLCNVPDGAHLVNTINQSTMVFQSE